MESFSFPFTKTFIESSSFLSPKSRHKKYIEGHFFNHGVDVVIPGCSSLPEVVDAASPDMDLFYFCKEVAVVAFTNVEFIDKVVKTGKFSAMSVGGHIDNHNVVAVLPKGELILSVVKDTYMELGLQGHPSKYTGRKPTRYIIKIDLLSPSFRPGKKNYERVRWCLTDRLNLTFKFLVHWDPKDPVKLVSLWPDIKIQDMSNSEHSWRKTNCFVPVIKSGTSLGGKNSTQEGTPSEEYCEPMKLLEWIGTVSCQCNQPGRPESFANTLCCPDPSQRMKCVLNYRWTGFISTERIIALLNSLRNTVTSSSQIPWAAVTIHGFEDSPVSWWEHEHGYHKVGDNHYTFVVFPDDRYLLYLAIGTHDEKP